MFLLFTLPQDPSTTRLMQAHSCARQLLTESWCYHTLLLSDARSAAAAIVRLFVRTSALAFSNFFPDEPTSGNTDPRSPDTRGMDVGNSLIVNFVQLVHAVVLASDDSGLNRQLWWASFAMHAATLIGVAYPKCGFAAEAVRPGIKFEVKYSGRCAMQDRTHAHVHADAHEKKKEGEGSYT